MPWSFMYSFKWKWGNTLEHSVVGTQFLTLCVTLNPWLILLGCCLAAGNAGVCIKCELFLRMVCGLPVLITEMNTIDPTGSFSHVGKWSGKKSIVPQYFNFSTESQHSDLSVINNLNILESISRHMTWTVFSSGAFSLAAIMCVASAGKKWLMGKCITQTVCYQVCWPSTPETTCSSACWFTVIEP